jgi:hypothetical protein
MRSMSLGAVTSCTCCFARSSSIGSTCGSTLLCSATANVCLMLVRRPMHGGWSRARRLRPASSAWVTNWLALPCTAIPDWMQRVVTGPPVPSPAVLDKMKHPADPDARR